MNNDNEWKFLGGRNNQINDWQGNLWFSQSCSSSGAKTGILQITFAKQKWSRDQWISCRCIGIFWSDQLVLFNLSGLRSSGVDLSSAQQRRIRSGPTGRPRSKSRRRVGEEQDQVDGRVQVLVLVDSGGVKICETHARGEKSRFFPF